MYILYIPPLEDISNCRGPRFLNYYKVLVSLFIVSFRFSFNAVNKYTYFKYNHCLFYCCTFYQFTGICREENSHIYYIYYSTHTQT